MTKKFQNFLQSHSNINKLETLFIKTMLRLQINITKLQG